MARSLKILPFLLYIDKNIKKKEYEIYFYRLRG